jgi:hypothetical protein
MKRLVQFSSIRETPSQVLEQLREIDSTLELIYISDGEWLCGSVQPNEERRLRGCELMRDPRPGAVRLGELVRQGFRPIRTFTESQLESGELVREIRVADWQYRTNAEAAYRENIRIAEGADEFEERLAKLLDFHHSNARDIWRYAFADQASVRKA